MGKGKGGRMFPAKDSGNDPVQKKMATTDSSVGGGSKANMAAKVKKASSIPSSAN
tara:strand:- start:96 stop:260 length:165 start_codon:yes stop_codon:yes gene_type:complete